MKLRSLLLPSACALAVLASSAQAEDIAAFITSLNATNATQLGRPSRNAIPQDWSGTETYPGILASTAGTTYFYNTYSFAASDFVGAPYVDITTFEPNNTNYLFLSAYAGSYDVNDRAAHWLGDEGFSGNYQTNDGGDFQVVLPTGDNLLLVLNSTGAPLGTTINIGVAAYGDTMYDPPTPASVTPEPSSWVLLGTGLLFVGLVAMRRARPIAW